MCDKSSNLVESHTWYNGLSGNSVTTVIYNHSTQCIHAIYVSIEICTNTLKIIAL